MKTIKAFLYTACLIIAMVGAWNLYDMNRSTARAEELYDTLAETKTDLEERSKEPEENDDVQAGYDPVLNLWLRELKKQNRELTAWITIDGTAIDYPVMQSRKDDDYYLNHDFTKRRDAHGTPFLDAACELEESDNLVIYGHNMLDGSMFQNLLYYKDKYFCENYSEICLRDEFHDHTYRAAVVMIVSATEARDFPYYTFTEFADETEFDRFIENCQQYAVWQSEELPQYGQRLISLSTCEYSKGDGRLVLIGCE